MPGTIQVSVSGLSDFETSSSIKVSMGKREYHQSSDSDTGDYSFPVTTLREKLIVTLLDGNGNDISCKEIETRLIIERGFLEEKFPVEGCRDVCLKMQFVLSKEDRDRIRFLRQSALRKKHGELVYGNTLKPKLLTSGLSSLDPRKMAAHEQAAADGESVTSTSVALRRSSSDVYANKESLEVIKSESAALLKETLSLNKLKTTEKPKSMRRSMSERNLSNVKKMISAFEAGLTQDKKLRVAKIGTDASADEEVSKNKTQDKEIRATKIQTCSHTDEVKGSKANPPLKNSENMQNLEEQPRSNSLSKQRREGREEKQSKFMYIEDSQQCNVRGSKLWIFPDGAKGSCTAASGPRHFNLVGANGFRRDTDSCAGENDSEKGFNGGSDVKTKDKYWRNTRRRSKNQKPESSEDYERSRGPVGQVMRALIMVGFASLVLLTR